MFFIAILLATTLSIAGSAAFFSIYGLANIFEGAFWAVVIMATSLEAGKLVAASFLYRYWKDIRFLMKTYLISAVLILMVITSAGIYGFLSAAYQQDTLPLKEMTANIELLKQEKTELKERKKQIDGIIAAISPNYITKRMEQMEKFAPETDKINARIPKITEEIRTLTSKKINQEVHTGPIVFIAKAMGREIDNATSFMILLIIFAFDPLAVALTLGTNMAILKRQEEKDKLVKKIPQPLKNEWKTTTTFETVDDSEVPEPEPEMPQNEGGDKHDVEHYANLENKGEAWRQQKFHTHRPDQFDKPVEGEPTPAITSIDDLEQALKDLNDKHELTETEKQTKSTVEELLRKKEITQSVRQHST